MGLTLDQRERYDRNIRLEGMGEAGQEKLLASKVLCVGAGGLGSAVLYYLAAAGVGTLGIVDCDIVEKSNLQRQVLHYSTDTGRDKVVSAAEKLEKINPDVNVIAIKKKLDSQNAVKLIADYDFIVDAVDNFEAKYAINDACVKSGKPFSHAGALAMRGQVMTHIPGGACLRCFSLAVPAAPETAKEHGILGAVAGHLGTLQAIEVISYLATGRAGLEGRIMVFEAVPYRYRILDLKKNLSCPVCGHKEDKNGR